MEKFNPNKKRWEPLWGDTSVDLTGFLSDKTVEKPEEVPRLPNTFEGPDYSKEDSNEFKDLYLVKHYPNRARASIEVYALGDLGRIPKDSIWGNIKELRYLYEEYKVAMSRHRRYKNIGQGNNCNWFVTKADDIRQVLNLYWGELEKGEINA